MVTDKVDTSTHTHTRIEKKCCLAVAFRPSEMKKLRCGFGGGDFRKRRCIRTKLKKWRRRRRASKQKRQDDTHQTSRSTPDAAGWGDSFTSGHNRAQHRQQNGREKSKAKRATVSWACAKYGCGCSAVQCLNFPSLCVLVGWKKNLWTENSGRRRLSLAIV